MFQIVKPAKYQIPRSISVPEINSGSFFLSLNNEFRQNTSLFGFELYGAVNGIISIQVNVFRMKLKEQLAI